MPKLTTSVPKYRLHRASGQSIVSIGGQDHYLGLHNSSASKEKYNRLVQEWLLRGRQPAVISGAKDSDICIAELCLAYFEEARNTYQKNGKPSSHLHNVHLIARNLAPCPLSPPLFSRLNFYGTLYRAYRSVRACHVSCFSACLQVM
jgi:hypothetical protein